MYMLNYQYTYWVTLRLSTVPISSYISSLWTCSNIVTLRQLHTHSISARLYLYNDVSVITSAVHYKNAHWILYVKKIIHELLSGTHIGCKPVLFAKWPAALLLLLFSSYYSDWVHYYDDCNYFSTLI